MSSRLLHHAQSVRRRYDHFGIEEVDACGDVTSLLNVYMVFLNVQVSNAKRIAGVQQGNGIVIYWLYSTFVESGMGVLVVMDLLSICIAEALHRGEGNLHEISAWSLRLRKY